MSKNENNCNNSDKTEPKISHVRGQYLYSRAKPRGITFDNSVKD